MASAILVGIVGIFIAGAVAGVMTSISLAVGREQRRCRREQRRRIRRDEGSFLSHDGQGQVDEFITDHAPDRLTGGARWMTGLYVRHTRPATDDLREDMLV